MTPSRKKIHVVVVLFAIGPALALCLAACGPTRPPDDRLAAAAEALDAARAAEAPAWAAAEWRNAERELAHARTANMQGDFDGAARLAARAEVDAELAAARARLAKTRDAVGTLQRENATLQADLARSDEGFPP